MRDNLSIEPDRFWELLGRIGASTLVTTTIGCGREQVAYSRAAHAADREQILIGHEAGGTARYLADVHHRRRDANLEAASRSLDLWVASWTSEQEDLVNAAFRTKSWVEKLERAKEHGISALLGIPGPQEETRKALGRLDAAIRELAEMTSAKELTARFHSHVRDFLENKAGQPNPDGLCMLIIIITSIYMLLLIEAIYIYILLAIFGVTFDSIFNGLLVQMCGP